MKDLMSKVLVLFFICFISVAAVADAYRVDENTLKWGVGPDPENQPDGELWYAYTDWDWYEGSLELDSAYPEDPNTQPYPVDPIEPATYCLKIRAGSQVDGSTIDATGYVFDLASADISGKVISGVHILNAYWNFPSGANSAVAPAFYDENGNRVFRGNPQTMDVPWWQDIEIDFTDNPTKSIRFVIEPYASAIVWSGNSMYIEQMEITLIDEEDAKCGTVYNPYPVGDINEDCSVDYADVAQIAEYWLSCNDPADPACN